MTMMRTDYDALGPVLVPADALYGAQTARALANFPVSGIPVSRHPHLVCALVMVKKAAALANKDAGIITAAVADAIVSACDVVLAGKHHDQFVVDVIQGGAGTSTNMNANEVLAHIASAIAGTPIHANDHVNASQSTNDVYPTAIRLALLDALPQLGAALGRAAEVLAGTARRVGSISKLGRTQLQDAVPMTAGDELQAFVTALRRRVGALEGLAPELALVNLGGTAIGTAVNAPQAYRTSVMEHLVALSGQPLRCADDLIEAGSDVSALVSASSQLRQVSLCLLKICGDLRLLSSGPRAGIGEMILPPLQPGSSLMPGKVNPVMPEMVSQVAFAVMGRDLSIALAAENGELQLNAMEPLIAHLLLLSIDEMSKAVDIFTERCLEGLDYDAARCEQLLAGSTAQASVLVPLIGYEKASEMVLLANRTGRPLADILSEHGLSEA